MILVNYRQDLLSKIIGTPLSLELTPRASLTLIFLAFDLLMPEECLSKLD